ncbi:MAG: hypothetical protein CVU39_07650 [Chloroflexi bacterium HGW-Chloroflexi-10]|nr:MAG: hypothetical protein CVU39_07650 [Chloroflexi bacterium HGW-Chloroflexi-10]
MSGCGHNYSFTVLNNPRSSGLSEEQICQALLISVEDIEKELARLQAKYGNRVCIIPESPQTIAYLRE